MIVNPGRQQLMSQEHEFLPSTWEMQIEFTALGYNEAQPLQAVEGELKYVFFQYLSLPLTLSSLVLSLSLFPLK